MDRLDRRRFICVSLAAVASTPAHAREALSGRLTITGSSTVAPLVLEMAKAFEKKHPKVRIDVQTGGSSRGIADARSALAHIGMTSRALYDTENDLVGHVIARDGICLIVHEANPVSTLTDRQVVDIFTGRITDWKDVGGRPGRISVVNKAEGRSTLDLFQAHFKLKNSDIKASVVIGDNAQGVKTVVASEGAIGYVSIGTAEFEAEQGTPIKLLPMSGIVPSDATVKNGTFPLTRPLTLVTKTQPVGLAKAFIGYAQSKDVIALVREQFFVPLHD